MRPIGSVRNEESLRVIHRRSRRNFLKLRQRAQTGWFGIAGAAAGGGQKRESGYDECGQNADHGVGDGRVCVKYWKCQGVVNSARDMAGLGRGDYLVGATYVGLVGAGAGFGQQEAASRAATAASMAVFIG